MQGIWYRKVIEFILLCYRKEAAGERIYLQNMVRWTDIAYGHAMKICNYLIGMGLVTAKKEGRVKEIKLTNLGKEVAKRLYEIEQLLRKSQDSASRSQKG